MRSQRIGHRGLYLEITLFLLGKDLIANYRAGNKANRCHHKNTYLRYLRLKQPDLQPYRDHPDKVGSHHAGDKTEQDSHDRLP